MPGTTLLHPVERVSWLECVEVCRWLGMTLPTEAQWEYAARAGSGTPWWTGDEREWLRGTVNLADQAAKAARATWPEIEDWPRSTMAMWPTHPWDVFEPNGFGLHNVHGNVWEWCQDLHDLAFYASSAGSDPVNDRPESGNRVSRGGELQK